MSPLIYLDTALGMTLIIILIFIDYIRKYNTDSFQRMLFLIILGAAFLSMGSDFISVVLESATGSTRKIFFTVRSLFSIFQNITFYTIVIFIDYFLYNNEIRSKKLLKIYLVFFGFYCISILLNLSLGFYFTVGERNVLIPGKFEFLRIVISFLPIFLCILDIFLSSQRTKQTQLTLIIYIGLLTGAGALTAVIFKTPSLVWLCLAAALLGTYFFIIRSDSKIDPLTGIGNRYSFNEFIEKLARRNSQGRVFHESWAVVMLDMDHFKEINDTLGHVQGDNALRDVATILRGCIRHSDFAARYGGDEFVLAIRAESNIEKLIARLRKVLALHNDTAGRPYKLEISYGYDIFTTGGGQSIDDFLAHVDNLMYKHKAERRRISDVTGNENQKPADINAGT